MSPVRGMVCLALFAPVAALAQVSQSRVAIEPAPSYSVVRIEPPRLHVCAAQQVSLADRKAYLDLDKAAIDAERAAIARDGDTLAAELRALDNRDSAAVAAHTERTAQHNARVAVHNGHVEEMNRAVALLTGDAAAFNAHCSTLRYSRR